MNGPTRYLAFVLFAASSLLLSACSEAYLKMHQVPENGYDQTLNYEFQAQVHADSEGQCQKMVVRVKPLNKLYWKEAPPDRLQLYDDDCLSPVRFERLQYLEREGGGMVRLSGVDVTRFWGQYFRLENELTSWLWKTGIF